MTHEIIEETTPDGIVRHIQVEIASGEYKSFPAVEGNPHYDAWVAEGNTAEVIEEP